MLHRHSAMSILPVIGIILVWLQFGIETSRQLFTIRTDIDMDNIHGWYYILYVDIIENRSRINGFSKPWNPRTRSETLKMTLLTYGDIDLLSYDITSHLVHFDQVIYLMKEKSLETWYSAGGSQYVSSLGSGSTTPTRSLLLRGQPRVRRMSLCQCSLTVVHSVLITELFIGECMDMLMSCKLWVCEWMRSCLICMRVYRSVVLSVEKHCLLRLQA